MDGFDAYTTYLAAKQHFTMPSYDFFKYNGKVRAKRGTFEGRRDRYFFEKLSRQPDCISLIIANLLEDVTYVNDMLSSEGLARHTKYQQWVAAASHNFKEELTRALQSCSFNDLFKFTKDSQYPPLLSGYLSKQISIQTIIILDRLVDFMPKWDACLVDDYLWPQIKQKFDKYKPFLVFDKHKMQQITVDLVVNRGDT